jgi:hypothetical protein
MDADEENRIGERGRHVVAQLLRAVEILLEARQRSLEEAARFAGTDHVDVDRREDLLRGEGLGQRLAPLDRVQHLGDHAFQLRVGRKICQGG